MAVLEAIHAWIRQDENMDDMSQRFQIDWAAISSVVPNSTPRQCQAIWRLVAYNRPERASDRKNSFAAPVDGDDSDIDELVLGPEGGANQETQLHSLLVLKNRARGISTLPITAFRKK